MVQGSDPRLTAVRGYPRVMDCRCRYTSVQSGPVVQGYPRDDFRVDLIPRMLILRHICPRVDPIPLRRQAWSGGTRTHCSTAMPQLSLKPLALVLQFHVLQDIKLRRSKETDRATLPC